MAEGTISFLLQKLTEIVIQKMGFMQEVEEQVTSLKRELEMMQQFLNSATEDQGDDVQLLQSGFISQIRQVAQDAEDTIETFILKVESQTRNRGLLGRCACFPNRAYKLDKIGEEIKTIQARLEQIDKSRERYRIRDINTGDRGMVLSRRKEDVELQRRLSPWQQDKHVVGLDEDVKLLLQKAILEEREGEGLSVAAIVGMGGIGKSTLARLVYNHAAVADRFDCRAWVVVSRESRPRETIMELILQITPTEDKQIVLEIVEKLPPQSLQEMLHETLQGRRYFIVLDDVWEEAHWKYIASALPNEDKASRLLLTSRSRYIASCARYVHDMKILNPEQSWELFLNKALIIDNKCPEELENIGREILKKCYGLPLAIAVVGGLLATQRQSKSKWEKVLRGISSHLGGCGSSVSTILELSYHNLPSKLKSCFMCLAFFKEDAIIRAKKLVQVWIAHGLIVQGDGGETIEEVAMSYLDELINRNMVQVKDIGKDEQVKHCYVHDLLRELSVRKAEKEIDFEILRDEWKSLPSYKTRHCAIYGCTDRINHSVTPNKHLRSLFFYGTGNFYGTRSSYKWKSFELLKVLDFEDFGLENLPDAIGELKGLRYLGLRNTRIWKLPSSLGCLKNLQVLDIAKNFIFMVEVPNVVWKMDSLRHLYMSAIICKAPLKIDTLINLQTLSCVSMGDWTPEHRANMFSLQRMEITHDYHSSNIGNLFGGNLRRYELRNMPSLDGLGNLRRLTKLKLQGELPTLPRASEFPPNLSYLTLIATCLIEDPMPVLEKLPSLMYLKLDQAYTGSGMVISDDGFAKIKVLTLRWMDRLCDIQVGQGAMPDLNRLEIYKCPNLEKNIPEEVRSKNYSPRVEDGDNNQGQTKIWIKNMIS